MSIKELYCRVRGRVQMVMYRDYASRKARGLGLAGYVKNLPDGSVEVVAQGERPNLERFKETLKKGSALSRVDRVDGEFRDPTGAYRDFTIEW